MTFLIIDPHHRAALFDICMYNMHFINPSHIEFFILSSICVRIIALFHSPRADGTTRPWARPFSSLSLIWNRAWINSACCVSLVFLLMVSRSPDLRPERDWCPSTHFFTRRAPGVYFFNKLRQFDARACGRSARERNLHMSRHFGMLHFAQLIAPINSPLGG